MATQKRTSRKNPAAVELGRRGGLARVTKGIGALSPEERKEISRKGVAARRKKAANASKVVKRK